MRCVRLPCWAVVIHANAGDMKTLILGLGKFHIPWATKPMCPPERCSTAREATHNEKPTHTAAEAPAASNYNSPSGRDRMRDVQPSLQPRAQDIDCSCRQ